MVYYGIFSSILLYGSQIWGQQNSIVKKLQVLQNKALRIIHFKPPRTSATPLFKTSRILKVADYVSLQNLLFAHDSLKGNLSFSLTGMDYCCCLANMAIHTFCQYNYVNVCKFVHFVANMYIKQL